MWQRLDTWENEEARSAQTFRRLADAAALHASGAAGLWRNPNCSWRSIGATTAIRTRSGPRATTLDSRRRRTSVASFALVTRRKIREEAARQAEIRPQQELAEAEQRRRARVAVVGMILALLLAAFGGYEAVMAIKETAVAHRAEARAVSTLSRQFTERGDATTGMLAALPLMPNAMLPGARTHIAAAAMALLDAWSHHREILTLIGHRSLVLNASFSADGKRVVTASWDKTAGVWDLSGTVPMAPVAIELSGYKGPVNTAPFGADGKLVVTASNDKTAQVWDAHTCAEIVELSGYKGPVNTASFSAFGK